MATLAKKPKMDMTQGNIVKQIILFAIPIVATTFMQLFFNTADTIMVGWFGGSDAQARTAALAAVSSCSALINLIICLFNGLSIGAGVSISHEIGAKKYDNIEKIVHTAVFTGIICGTFVATVGFVFADKFLLLTGLDSPEQGGMVLTQATAYMRAYFCGVPASLIYNYCAAMLRADGESSKPFAFITAAGVVNIVFNFVFVCLLGMGALGVGVATAISQWVSCILIIAYMLRTNGNCKFSPRKLKIHKAHLKKIIVIGLPAGIQSSFFSVANVLIQSSINSFSEPIIAGNGIGSNIGQYVNQTGSSISNATLTFIGQNVGAKNPKRIKQGLLWSAGIVVAVNLTLATIINIFSYPLLSLYAPGAEADPTGSIATSIATGQLRLLIVGMAYWIAGLDQVAASTLQGFGKSTLTMSVALIGACGFRVLWIFTVFQAFHEIWVLYLAFPISWILLTVTQLILCSLEIKKFKAKCITEEKENEIPVQQ